MESESNNSRKGNSKMGFIIDLNETPVPSPRETVDEGGVSNVVSLCPVCRKGIPVGRVSGKAAEEREESKCFRCLLKKDAAGSSGGGRGGVRGSEVGRFDMNALPPREPEEGNCVEFVAVRDGNDGGKIQVSIPSSFSRRRAAVRQLNPGLDDIGYYCAKPMSIATNSSNSAFQAMFRRRSNFEDLHPARRESTFDLGVQGGHSTQLGVPLDTPHMVYLQDLREYIANRSGVLGEGWRVEFEFCNKRLKTSAIYIAPDGSKLKSPEDVACYIGLPSRNPFTEIGKGSDTGFGLLRGRLKIDPTQKESYSFPTAQNSRQKQRMLKANKNQGFLSGTGIISCSELAHNKSFEELGASDTGSHRDGIRDGFPIQFQDFFLISAGNVDPRPSYHSTNQIYPVGYRSSWHDRVTGSLFVCDVVDGGDSGPIFKVQRYPCTKQSIPVGATVLSKAKPLSCEGDGKMGKNDLAAFQVVDDDSLSTITLLDESSPPSLDNCLSASKGEDIIPNLQEDNSSISDLECLPHRSGNMLVDNARLTDVLGEFQIEGMSTSHVWEMIANTFLHSYLVTYNQKGRIKFFCGHHVHENDENLDCHHSISRYGSSNGLVNLPPLVQDENEFKIAHEMLFNWLKQDRFGLDADFVQEIIEQLPGVAACSKYTNLNNRRHNSVLQTVGSGFLQAERKTNGASGTLNRSQLKSGVPEDALKRGSCPPGKPLNLKLPSCLMGDALQVWEYAWRFADVLGLGLDFSFHELELELTSPWIDYPLKSRHDIGDALSTGAASLGRCSGLLSGKIIISLLKVLVCELISKAATYVCPNFDSGESKSRRGKKRDLDSLAALKKTKLDMLPINELTWHEIARRYILAVLSMEGNLESAEIASRESGKVFHCLQGDGGILCGSLTGIAALEGDAMVLADAMKEVYGSLKSKNEIVNFCEREPDVNVAQTIEVNDSSIPDWVKILIPVKWLPTNVGARIRRLVNEVLHEYHPPEWARKKLEHSISKEIYKGNASGPTKRAVVSVIVEVCGTDDPLPKPEKKEKVKVKTSVTDLISKQCRNVLRQAAALDEDKVFCNLLARIMLNPNDNDEDGLLGYPAMVSRPLDFRTIDLRLAAGAYGGSPEAFIDDVREVWRNIRTAYGDRSDLIAVAEDLSEKFEDLYEKEVLTLVHKVSEVSNANEPNADVIRARDDLLKCVCNSSLPRAPWEDGICKVCGMDKDDDNVLLCDKCDSEYHRYCLNPPLLKIPEGNWYCPSCVSGQSTSSGSIYGPATNQSRKRKNQGEFTYKYLEELTKYANLMEVRECWDFTVPERVFFMKFLFDEALNSATIREHMEQCSSRVIDLQQKLRALTSELKLMKVKEDILGLSSERPNSGPHNGRGDLKSDASSSLLAIESGSKENVALNKHPDRPAPSRSSKSLGSGDKLSQSDCQLLVGDQDQHGSLIVHVSQGGSVLSTSQRGHNLSGSTSDRVMENVPSAAASSMHESHGHPSPDQADQIPSKDSSKASTIKNDIVSLQNSIAFIESELLKASLRRDYLGRDSNGRAYWIFQSTGARPWIVSSGDLKSKKMSPEELIGIPGSDNWMYYESDDEIDKLVGWLRDIHAREKELRESILQLQSYKLRDSQPTENHRLSRGISAHSRRILPNDFLATKAMTALEKKFGPCLGTGATDVCQRLASGVSQDGRMYRCECLEMLWHSKAHCFSCHQSFPSNEKLRQHSRENCKPAASTSKRSHPATEDASKKDTSKRKKPKIAVSQDKRPTATVDFLQPSTSEKQNDGSGFTEFCNSDTPFHYEEVKTRMVVPGSVKEAVNEIGLIGSGGAPSFIQTESPYFNDPALVLVSATKIEGSSSGKPNNFKRQKTGAAVGMQENKESNRSSKHGENAWAEGSIAERLRMAALRNENDQVPPVKEKGASVGKSKGNIIRESSSRPLTGKASEVLRLLKINLLDMDAALPEDALRASRTNQEKRQAWRGFVKSARSIYKMIQAVIIFEDAIQSDYLRNEWWYWSSPSTAAKITTLSALALRIYALDLAICYDRPLVNSATEGREPTSGADEEASSSKNVANVGSPSQQNTPEPEPADTPRTTRSRASKRKKDQSS